MRGSPPITMPCARSPGSRGIRLIADACHSPGATYRGTKVGTLADISCFSFHPVKHMTTCEGGMCVTADAEMAAHMRCFRNHGIDSDHRSREAKGAHAYDMAELGYNYRMPDVLCALGLAQLPRLDGWVAARQKIARAYSRAFAALPQVVPLYTHPDRSNAYHLYVVRLAASLDRDRVFAVLRQEGIGANVHYAPVYWHSFYQARGYRKGLCPVAERLSRQILTLPMFPGMTEEDVARVVDAVMRAIVTFFLKRRGPRCRLPTAGCRHTWPSHLSGAGVAPRARHLGCRFVTGLI